MDIIMDTDIGRDPDDAVALLFLLARPEAKLRAVTVTPGDRDQVALVRFLLTETGCADIPVGVVEEQHSRQKSSLTKPHFLLLREHGASTDAQPDGVGWNVIRDCFSRHPGTTLLTTGPLDNVGQLLRNTDITIERSVTMGGYWGAPGLAESLPEFNFNGNIDAARSFLESERFSRRLLVGKNVTHQVLYDEALHCEVERAGRQSRAMALIHELMSLRGRLDKKLHDAVAAAAAVREDLITWTEVQPFRRDKGWGSTACTGTKIWAAVDVDIPRFRRVLVGEHVG